MRSRGLVTRLGRLSARGQSVDGPPAVPCDVFVFDLASVTTYLLASRVLRAAPRTMEWRPMASSVVADGPEGLDADCARAEHVAQELEIPLMWPSTHPAPLPRAMRVARFAAREGYGGTFMELASRLAFAGGMDLESPTLALAETTAERAQCDPGQAAQAFHDPSFDRDEASERAWLTLQGIGALPALRHGGLLLCGSAVIDRYLRERGIAATRRGPFAPS